MIQKKLFISLAIAIFCLAVVPSFAIDPTSSTGSEPVTNKARTEQVMTRLNEIRNMDRSSLSRTEKRELRKEVRKLKKESKERKNGIYLSMGAIIVIGVLLILLL